MPNTKTVRSIKNSGMQKNDGGIPTQGFSPDHNTTYRCNDVNLDIAEDAPLNTEYSEKIPSTPTPLGSVDVGPVSLGGKKS